MGDFRAMLNAKTFAMDQRTDYIMRLPLLIVALLLSHHVIADLVVTHTAPANDGDRRHEYEVAVLQLLLEKTRTKFGNFRLIPAPSHVTPFRAIENLRHNKHSNYIRLHGYTRKLSEYPELSFIDFPIQMGILGYRVCFVSEKKISQVAKADTLEKLRNFRYGLVKGWLDTEILRTNGFKVHTTVKYDKLFNMTAVNRFDLFCRGASEIKAEYEQYKNLPGLAIDESFAFYYPHPRFFFTHKENKRLVHRLREGLNKVNHDGSLLALWKQHHQESLAFVKLSTRRIIRLNNPNIDDIIDVEQYIYRPGKD